TLWCSRSQGGARAARLGPRTAASAADAGVDGGARRSERCARRVRRGDRMSLLPDTDRILLGPGPSLTAPRVMRALASPTIGHLDPLMIALLDDLRVRLARIFRAPQGSFAFAVSGTGTAGMET